MTNLDRINIDDLKRSMRVHSSKVKSCDECIFNGDPDCMSTMTDAALTYIYELEESLIGHKIFECGMVVKTNDLNGRTIVGVVIDENAGNNDDKIEILYYNAEIDELDLILIKKSRDIEVIGTGTDIVRELKSYYDYLEE